MEGKERIQGYTRIMESIMQEYSSAFPIGGKSIYDYINPVVEHEYIATVEITDNSLPDYLIEEIKKYYPVRR